MAATSQPLTNIQLRGRRKRLVASKLLKLHTKTASASSAPCHDPPIHVVCIADTHNKQPRLPAGDVLIHAGDLTENGSFAEMQAGLTWLAGQPHRYKIYVAGNHDVLLDDAFLTRHPERRYGQTQTKDDLDWGGVLYLEDSMAALSFTAPDAQASGREATTTPPPRTLTVFGSPWTPQYGVSAFQYRPDDTDHWASIFSQHAASQPDIVVTHGPPKHHLNSRDVHQAGCPYLLAEISRLRPRLVVFGHIHAAYGRQDRVVLDGVQTTYDDVLTGWAGWGRIGWMAVLVIWARLTRGLFRTSGNEGGKATTFVNAAVVGGPHNELKNEPIVVAL
ncbi:phosphoesterase [Niveomyces insectorum RCEF 264]|uniref:Phosphoesterase n=1 Tax=Niveomyces insectorum RCEF 264 TaxID=1081102 RepID=A0A167SRP7_9HYPO|nr:phosphoesterase [Niveomyces insectorum RCEF 264]